MGKKLWKIGAIVLAAMLVLALPCALGFNVLSGVQPFGEGSVLMDLEDFIISNNILPLGSLVYVLFCTTKRGWGSQKFLEEANAGRGLAFPKWLVPYTKYVLPVILFALWAWGYIDKFF